MIFFLLNALCTQYAKAIEFYAHSLEGSAIDNNGILVPIPDSGSRAFSLSIVQNLINDKKQEKIKIVPLSRALKLLESDRPVIIAGIIFTPKRATRFQWIGTLYSDKYKFYESKDAVLSTGKLSDHLNSSVCVVADSAAEEIVESIGFKDIHKTSSYSTCLKMLAARRIKFAPILESDFSAKIHGAQLDLNEIRLSGLPDISVESYLVASKKTSANDVVDLMTKLAALKRSPHYLKLKKIYAGK